jgi:hypothetical protein
MPSYSSSSSSSQRASPHALTSSSLPQSAPILPSVSMSSIQGMVLDLSGALLVSIPNPPIAAVR